jgi:N-acyl homoserine lactone hydrolase
MRLWLLPLGQLHVDKGKVLTPGRDLGVWVDVPVAGYLIETDDGRHILIDTGVHRAHITDPDATFRDTSIVDELTVRMRPEDDIANRLGGLGLGVEDIDVLVSTHFHFDHAGNHSDFGASRIVVQRRAYEHGKANHDPFTQDLWDLPHLEYVLLDGDVELVPGVELIETSGHAPGHTSVLVRLPETGPVLLAIDAISTFENLTTDNWATAADPDAARESAHRLRAIAEREGALFVSGHDPAQWATLRLSPDSYT